MFKISITESRGAKKMVLEGKLVSPWTTELENAWSSAAGRQQKVVIDLTNVTLISPDGEDTLLRLMRAGARFSCRDVLTKHVLKKLARLCRCQKREKSGNDVGIERDGRFPPSSDVDSSEGNIGGEK